MSTFELRRHSLTKHDEGRGRGSQLSQEGIDRARVLGATIGPFDAVFVSVVSKTLETAVAMGFAVTDMLDGDRALWEESQTEVPFHSQWEWPDGFSGYRPFLDHDGPLSRFALHYANLWKLIAAQLPDDGNALVISHGGLLEPGLVACFPDLDHAAWGRPFGQLEGARLEWKAGKFDSAVILRQ
jgi:broad specificity phosphatase PhoE